jgi:hypothetical protein
MIFNFILNLYVQCACVLTTTIYSFLYIDPVRVGGLHENACLRSYNPEGAQKSLHLSKSPVTAIGNVPRIVQLQLDFVITIIVSFIVYHLSVEYEPAIVIYIL